MLRRIHLILLPSPILILSLLSILILATHGAPSRAYPIGCANESPSYYDYDNYPWPPPVKLSRSSEDFWLLKRLGSGKFSDVFEAVDDSDKKVEAMNLDHAVVDVDNLVVIKCLKPVALRKIRRELLVLTRAFGLPNLVRLRGVVCFEKNHVASISESTTSTRMTSLILDHAGPSSRWLCHGIGRDTNVGSSGTMNSQDKHLSLYEIKYFIYHLLIALDALHSCGIMHRDVKPRNILITRGNVGKSLMLIDLGLADFYLPGKSYNVRVASRHYKAPELLVGDQMYTYSVDLWGVGCVLVGLLLRREPLFRGKDNLDQLCKIVQVLGTIDYLRYCKRHDLRVTKEVQDAVLMEENGKRKYPRNRRSWTWYFPNAEEGYVPPRQGLDLVDGLLVYDHEKRLTAREAMKHHFFDEVREEIDLERSAWDAGGGM